MCKDILPLGVLRKDDLEDIKFNLVEGYPYKIVHPNQETLDIYKNSTTWWESYRLASRFDWPAVKAEWDERWAWEKLKKPDATIKLQKSPANMFIVPMMTENFANAKWILMVRNPYVHLEIIIDKIYDHSEKAIKLVALQIIDMLTIQKENKIFLGDNVYCMTYESLVSTTETCTQEIKNFIPELSDLSFHGDVMVRDQVYTGLAKDENEKFLNKLKNVPGAIDMVNTYFAQHEDLLNYWGYELITNQ
jgi:hypothetical protein